ncbi:hypothetical protein ACWPKO_25580 (plasmid) [Coraliomargarita sp. W4R53]
MLGDWLAVDNAFAGSPTPYGLNATGARTVYQNGDVRGAGREIGRGVETDGVTLGSLVHNVIFENCTTGICDPQVTLTAAHSVLENPDINCDTCINASATVRHPTLTGTIYRSNRDGAVARIGPGFELGDVALTATTVNFSRRLGIAPALKDIRVMPTSSLGAAKYWWLGQVTRTFAAVDLDATIEAPVTFQVAIEVS